MTEHYSKDFEELGGKVFKDFPITGFKEASESPKAGDDNVHKIRVFGEGGKVFMRKIIFMFFDSIFCTGN